MPNESSYDPNSISAVLSRLETKADESKEAFTQMKADFEVFKERIWTVIKEDREAIQDLKTSDAVRNKAVTVILSAAALLGWAIDLYVSWKH